MHLTEQELSIKLNKKANQPLTNSQTTPANLSRLLLQTLAINCVKCFKNTRANLKQAVAVYKGI